ncbi:MAG TPA: hypothetical protein VH416_08710 [Gaiellaceae bacterium]
MPAFVGLSFLSPAGALVALAIVLPLLGFALLERRAGRVRRALRLPEPEARSRWEPLVLIGAVAVLLGIACAQPVLSISHSKAARSDAEILFAFDVSRSMEAAASPDSPSRLERAKALGNRLRDDLADVPSGIVGLTDRTLPYLFPTANGAVFRAAVRDDVRIEYPPPTATFGDSGSRVTLLSALSSLATKNYYSPGITRRVLIVLSDDETVSFSYRALGAVFRKAPRIRPIFVHLWNGDEHVWVNGRPNPAYHPDPSSGPTAQRLADATGGSLYDEHQVDAIVAAARAQVGSGGVQSLRLDRARTPIAPWVALAAIVPLGLVLRRRNLPAKL